MTDQHDDPDLTSEFWGAAPAWRNTGSTPTVRRRDERDPSGPIARLRRDPSGEVPRVPGAPTGPVPRTRRDSSGPIPRTRRHHDSGAVATVAPPVRTTDDETGAPTIDDPRDAAFDGRLDDGVVEPRPVPGIGVSFGAVDPFLIRLAIIVAVGVLLIPLALAFRSSDTADGTVRSQQVVASGGPALGRDRAVPVDAGAFGATGTSRHADTPASNPPTAAAPADAPAATATAPPVTVPPCTMTYEVHAGDFWIRLAEESGVRLADLLRANGATVQTPLYPGDDICLPPGATRPSPPTTTTAPTTTAAPAPPSRPSTAGSSTGSSSTARSAPAPTPPPTTAPPATVPRTTPPTTTAPRPRASTESPAQVEAIIREIWPADQADRAVLVAQRESRLRPDAYNGHCCYGVFQIYWSVHRSWLSSHGVTTSAHLLDARTNVRMAYELYRRSGGWGPWSQTAY